MDKWKKMLVIGGVCSFACTFPAAASTNLETGSSLAGISVTLNNFYAGTEEPEKTLASGYADMEKRAESSASGGSGAQAGGSGASDGGAGTSGLKGGAGDPGAGTDGNAGAGGAGTGASDGGKGAGSGSGGSGGGSGSQNGSGSTKSAYDNIAVSNISGSVNIRTEANTSSNITGKIYNDCAATILDTVDGEGGKWYKIQSGSVTGYIKAEYFVTGQAAETRAKEVGTTYGTVVDTPSLRLRESPDLTSKTLTLLAEGAHYTVLEEQGGFLKVAVDTDLEGYVYKDYMKTSVEFKEAVSTEEEQAKAREEAKRKQEAEEALKKLEEAKRAQAAKESAAAASKAAETTKAETTKAETTKAEEPEIQVIAANPENGSETTVAAPVETTEKETEKATEKAEETIAKGPGAESSDEVSSPEVTSATRNAIVAYARQFLGNPYVYGGTSLTNGADCSGFVMSVYAHFGITTGRSSRDQAARGRTIDVSAVQPGDLLFYASGNYINHVGIYVGGGQIIHASTPATGICYAPSNYRTPCKAVSFLD